MIALFVYELVMSWQAFSDLVLGPGRVVAAVASLVALFGWVGSSTHQWSMFGPRAQRVAISVGWLLFWITIGLLEAVTSGGNPVFGVLGILGSLLALVGALVYPDRPAFRD
jgi:hypothetical protein